MSSISRRQLIKGTAAASAALMLPVGANAADTPVKTNADQRLAAFRGNSKPLNEDYSLPFTPEEYQQRINRMRKLMAKHKIDTLYMSSPEAICYFTGFQATWYRAHASTRWPGMAAVVINVDHEDIVAYEAAEEFLVFLATSHIKEPNLMPSELFYDQPKAGADYIANDLKQRGWTKGTLGMEKWSYVPNPVVSEMIESSLTQAGATVSDATGIIRAVRKVKSPQELRYIEEAALIADIGLQAIADNVRPGITQLELQGHALQAMMAAGGELPGINQGVLSGPLGSAHALSSRRPINPGETFIVDLAGVVNRYHANVCRTFVYGEPPKATMKETQRLTEFSKAGVELLCKTAKAGTPVVDVARTLREFFIEAGVWELRQWVGGYELGIAFPPDWVGEWIFNADADDEPGVFEANSVTNFESVFAKPGDWPYPTGVNIDTIIYGENGTRSLSQLDLLPIVAG